MAVYSTYQFHAYDSIVFKLTLYFLFSHLLMGIKTKNLNTTLNKSYEKVSSCTAAAKK